MKIISSPNGKITLSISDVGKSCPSRGFLMWQIFLLAAKFLNLQYLIFCSYCKFENFLENFIFTKSVIRNICHVKNSSLGHDLPTSVNDRVNLPFGKGLIFKKFPSARFREKRTLTKISQFTVALF